MTLSALPDLERVEPSAEISRANGKSFASASSKIVSLESLAETLARLKVTGSRIVLCHGVFDLLHIGHIRHFEQARRLGDVLVVSMTPDQLVNKGPHRPAFSEKLRAEAVAALSVVDFVAINRWPTAAQTIRLLEPDVYCKGSEYRSVSGGVLEKLQEEIGAASEVGATVEYTDDLTFSSSQLINTYFSAFPPETEEWLRDFRRRRSPAEVMRRLDGAARLRALVVGEAIIDEYVFCNSIGKSTKDPILACQYVGTEAFGGGSLAVANHLAGICDEVGLITYLGENERREEFVRSALRPNVRPYFVTRHGSPTIHKRRYVEPYSQNKLLELYVMNDRPPEEKDENGILRMIETVAPDYDLVVCADYGHEVMTPAVIAGLTKKARFLAVNTQSNAGNRGFNTISKYWRADYVCLASYEVCMETRMREGNPEDLLLQVAGRIDCPSFTVTLGKDGSLHYSPEEGLSRVPSVAMRVVDRVGGGDAILAVTSLLVAQKTPWDIVGFLGNVAASQVVAELGNRVAVSHDSILRSVTSLMK